MFLIFPFFDFLTVSLLLHHVTILALLHFVLCTPSLYLLERHFQCVSQTIVLWKLLTISRYWLSCILPSVLSFCIVRSGSDLLDLRPCVRQIYFFGVICIHRRGLHFLADLQCGSSVCHISACFSILHGGSSSATLI